MASRGNYKTIEFYQSNTNGVKDGFDTFSVAGLYYFTCNKNSNVCLISEGYTSSSARNRGIQSVAKNLLLATQYHFEITPNKQHYFILKAGNNQEIAQSKIFKNEDGMHALIGWIIGKRFSVKLADEVVDEDLHFSANGSEQVFSGIYSNDIDYHLFKGTNGKQYFSFKNKEDKTLLLNTNVRGYDNITIVNEILKEVIQFAPNIKNYDFKLTKNGKYYFYLKNGDAANIAKSTFFATEEEMMGVISALTLNKSTVSLDHSPKQNENIANTQNGVQSSLFTKVSKSVTEVKQIDNKLNNKEPKAEDLPEVDEFTFLLKQQQKAELEVRLKREKEEKDRKEVQNEFAKANAAVLRKHKQDQSIEVDDKIKQEDLIKAKEQSPAKRPTLDNKSVQDASAVKEPVKPKTQKTTEKKADKPKTKQLNAGHKKAEQTKTDIKPIKKEIPEKVVKPKAKLSTPPKTKAEQPVKPKPPTKKKTKEDPIEILSIKKDVDPEIEKERIASQARLDELKKAAVARKQNEKEKLTDDLETVVEEENTPDDKKTYDWWTKNKETDATVEQVDIFEDDNDEPANLFKILKPALIGILAVALIFAAFRTFNSSNKGKAVANVVAETNKDVSANTALINTSNSASKNPYTVSLPPEFEDFNPGSVEWHLAKCILDENCSTAQRFQWVETNFLINAADLSSEAFLSIDNIVKILKIHDNSRLEIYGHIATDERDNDTRGNSLSEIRAKKVYSLLRERGISAERLSFKGLGKTKPIHAGKSLTAHYQNKRTEIVLFKDQRSI